MIGLHPDTGLDYTRMRNQELIDEAQHAFALRDIQRRPSSRRLIVATGRTLVRIGDRLQRVPA